MSSLERIRTIDYWMKIRKASIRNKVLRQMRENTLTKPKVIFMVMPPVGENGKKAGGQKE